MQRVGTKVWTFRHLGGKCLRHGVWSHLTQDGRSPGANDDGLIPIQESRCRANHQRTATGRTDAGAWMLEAWFELRGPDEAANQWIRKAGAEHYGEHLSRLRDWVAEVVDLRTRPKVDEWEG